MELENVSWVGQVGAGMIFACLPLAVAAVVLFLWDNPLLYGITLLCTSVIVWAWSLKKEKRKSLNIAYLATLVIATSLLYAAIT